MARSWNQMVAEGRRLVAAEGDIKWKLGDLALEVAPAGPDGAHNGSTEKLQRFAEEIDVDVAALRQYRQMSEEWPPGTRVPGASWTAHRWLRGEPNKSRTLKGLVRDGITSSEDVRRALGRPVSASNVNMSSPVAEQAEAVKQHLADPAVLRKVIRDDRTAINWNRATLEKQKQTIARTKRNLREQAPGFAEFGEYLDASARIHHADRDLRDALELLRGLPSLPADARADLRQEIDQVAEKLELVREFTKARRSASLTDEIEEFLAGQ